MVSDDPTASRFRGQVQSVPVSSETEEPETSQARAVEAAEVVAEEALETAAAVVVAGVVSAGIIAAGVSGERCGVAVFVCGDRQIERVGGAAGIAGLGGLQGDAVDGCAVGFVVGIHRLRGVDRSGDAVRGREGLYLGLHGGAERAEGCAAVARQFRQRASGVHRHGRRRAAGCKVG